GFGTPLRAANAQWFAGHHARDRVAVVHAVGIHDPGHRLRACVDVRRGDVAVWPDEHRDLGRVAARHALQLAHGHLLRVANHPALCAAVRDPHYRALPGHPHGQRADLVQIYLGVVADAALRGPAREVVLHAVPGEHADVAVVHLDGKVHRQL